MQCLICEKKMIGNDTNCKMCGMSIDDEKYLHGNQLFCSKKCLDAFDNILQVHGKNSKIVERKIVL